MILLSGAAAFGVSEDNSAQAGDLQERGADPSRDPARRQDQARTAAERSGDAERRETVSSWADLHGLDGETNGARLSIEDINDVIVEAAVDAALGDRDYT